MLTRVHLRSCQLQCLSSISSEPRRGIESDTLGWSSAAELGRAPGMEGAHGNQAALQRDSSVREKLLCEVQQG